MLRKHQKEMQEVVDRIRMGERIKIILLHVTPGGGKSAIPIIAGDLIRAGLADSLAWIVPRNALQDQGERNFLDPYFRSILNHNLCIRSSTNDYNPCRDTNGLITTYQAVAMDNRNLINDFSKKRYVLILDEFHHVEEDGIWHKSLQPLVNRAEYIVLMTGTLERGNEKKIAFIDYQKGYNNVYIPILQDNEHTAFVRYSRSDALAEKAIIPLKFILSDGEVEWEDKRGQKNQGNLSSLYESQGAALFTALSTEFSSQLLKESLSHWLSHKKYYPSAKLLIVTANFEHAKKFKKMIEDWGIQYRIDIATSHDSPQAIKVIRNFKEHKIDIMVTIAMAYEGLDCPSISHIACLTNIRSTPWIEQMIARAVRIDPMAGPYENQIGYVFAPDDFMFHGVVNRIKAEQTPIARENKESGKNKNGESKGEKEPDIIPLSGEITGSREINFGYHNAGSAAMPNIEPIKTVSDLENELREKIDKHIREYSFANYYKPARINSEIKDNFSKARQNMTLSELKSCYEYVKYNYPIQKHAGVIEKKQGVSGPRGKGRRVPTQATIWEI